MYKDFDHGYAATVHKTQGSTIDQTFVLGSRHFDKHTAYVAMSRHRENVTMYYAKDEFKDFEDLQRVIGREQAKGLIVDYGLPRGIEIDDRLIQAERAMSHAERNIQAQEWQQQRAEEQYVKQMKGQRVQVEFPREKSVEGNYMGLKDVDGRKYAVIDTHADPTKGVRYMIPYDKEYDQMMKFRQVEYDGNRMKTPQDKTPTMDKELGQGKPITLTPESQLTSDERAYRQLMEQKGIRVDFPKDKSVEGNYMGITEVNGKRFGVIDTHPDPTKGVRYMVPYSTEMDKLLKFRSVAFDGKQISYVQTVKDLIKGIGKGFEK